MKQGAQGIGISRVRSDDPGEFRSRQTNEKNGKIVDAAENTPGRNSAIARSLAVAVVREDASRYCPLCSQRLESRRCKLICSICGYYMSCADYY